MSVCHEHLPNCQEKTRIILHLLLSQLPPPQYLICQHSYDLRLRNISQINSFLLIFIFLHIFSGFYFIFLPLLVFLVSCPSKEALSYAETKDIFKNIYWIMSLPCKIIKWLSFVLTRKCVVLIIACEVLYGKVLAYSVLLSVPP